MLVFKSANSFAGYNPPVTFERTLDTYNINKDGTYVLISDNINFIETEKGVEDDGQVDVEYNSSMEKIRILSAFTLQPDGKRINVPRSGIKDTADQITNGAPMFSDIKHKVIIFPQVKVGSRLCYIYRLEAHKVSFKNHFILSSYFSPHYKYGTYVTKLNISKSLNLNVDSFKVKVEEHVPSNGQRHYQFEFSQADALPPEDDELDLEDFSPYFVVSTFNDQIEMGAYYQSNLVKKAKLTPEIQNLSNKLTEGTSDQKDQARIIYDWVRANIRYVAVHVGNGGFVPHSTTTILHNQYGDCKDHALLLEVMLRAKGIESTGALINLGAAYTLPKFAVARPQNHIITYIPNLDIYLDSTSKYTKFGTLPFQDLGKTTVLTAINKIGHTPVMTKDDFRVDADIKLIIKDDGSIEGTSHVVPNGSADSYYREKRAAELNDDDAEVVKDILRTNGETGSGIISSTDPNDYGQNFVIDSKFILDPISNFPGPAAFKIPIGISPGFINAVGRNKPKETRVLPYTCYPTSFLESYELEFPSNVKVNQIPQGVIFRNSDIEYDSKYELKQNKLYVTRALIMQHNKEFCLAEEKDYVRELFPVLQKDLRAQIFYEPA